MQKATHNWSRVFSRSARLQGGQAVVEFALIVPMLFLMLVGVVYIAQGFNLQVVLYGAAYEGAKVWAKGQPGSGIDHCTPPDCDPNSEEGANNFESYVVTAVKRYLRTNGYDAEQVRFFTREGSYQSFLEVHDRARESVRLDILYPYRLPIGSFAESYKQIWIGASVTMKRGT
jgi:hypothetical protein